VLYVLNILIQRLNSIPYVQMTEYYKSMHPAASAAASHPRAPISRRIVKTASASGAALSQASGLARFNSLARSLSCPNVPTSSSNADATVLESAEEIERRLDEEARKAVSAEILTYEAEGVIDDDEELENFDLLRFWQVMLLTLCSDGWKCTYSSLPDLQA
jgi:hypothetical protein